MINPKDSKFLNWKEKEQSQEADLENEKAQAKAFFQDLTFGQQHKKGYQANKFLRFLCNAVSAITGTLAIWLVLSFIMGAYAAGAIAGLVSSLFEIKKNHYNNIGFKYLLKYKDRSKKIIFPMAGAAFLSLTLAIIGAFTAPKLNPAPKTEFKPAINLDSLDKYYQERIKTATAGAAGYFSQHAKPKKDGSGLRWSTHKNAKPLKEVHSKKEQLITDETKERQLAINQAKEKNKKIEDKNKKLDNKNIQEHQKSTFLSQILLIILAVLFELLYYYISYEMAFYLLRVYIDDKPEEEQQEELDKLENKSFLNILKGQSAASNTMQIKYNTKEEEKKEEQESPPNVLTSNVKTSNVKTSNVKTSNVKTSNVKTSNVKQEELKPGEAICKLKECSKPYQYFRKTQKYCGDECRKAAHLKKKLQEKLEIINNS